MKFFNADKMIDFIYSNQIHEGEDLLEMINSFPTVEINVEKPKIVDYGTPLKSCPFCGGEANYKLTETSQHIVCVNIVCGVCGCQTRLFSDPNDPLFEEKTNKAIRNACRVWNRRIMFGRKEK